MFNLFGDSTFGKIGNAVVNNSKAGQLYNTIGDIVSPNSEAPKETPQSIDAKTNPFAAFAGGQDPYAEAMDKSTSFTPIQTDKPGSPTMPQLGQDVASASSAVPSEPPKATGSMGIKKIIGMVYPMLGMAFAKHDENQRKQWELSQQGNTVA